MYCLTSPFVSCEQCKGVITCHVLQVVQNGNPIERKNWFPDIEPLFKLLGYENVPPYLKVK